MEEEDSKEMANAKDEGEECESKQYDVVEAQGRIEGKEESEDDIDDKDKKCKKEPDVVDGSPRNSFLLLIQVVLQNDEVLVKIFHYQNSSTATTHCSTSQIKNGS